MRPYLFFFTLILLLSACTVPKTAAPTAVPTAAPTLSPADYLASGGGEPRSAGYWLLWNTCAEGNQSQTAIDNGGRAAGWILLDDLLASPGILVGRVGLSGCQPAVNLLLGLTVDGDAPEAEDLAYPLAAQLLAAQLNLAAGSYICTAADQAVQKAQLLLVTADFRGAGAVLGAESPADQRAAAAALTDQLAAFNAGGLCK